MMREQTDRPDEPSDGLDREGHLSPLTVERIAAGELPDPSPGDGPVGAHLAGCAPCRVAVDGARDYTPPASLKPPAELRRAAAGGGMQRRVVIAAVVALAAAALVFALRPDTGQGGDPVQVTPGDGIRVKGTLALEIFARRGGQGEPQPIDDARTVRPGDQLGFRAQATRAGHLLILGVDSQGETYPVHPPGAAPSAARLAPSASPVTLKGAIEFDATAGTETLVALFCPAPVAYTDVAPRLAKLANRVARAEALPRLSPDCEQTVHRLEKTP